MIYFPLAFYVANDKNNVFLQYRFRRRDYAKFHDLQFFETTLDTIGLYFSKERVL